MNLKPEALSLPFESDWGWRPELWCRSFPQSTHGHLDKRSELDDDIVLFHDCQAADLTARQYNHDMAGVGSAYAFEINSQTFDGNFLSLAIDVPQTGIKGLDTRYIIHLETALTMQSPVRVSARINIKSGPNFAQMPAVLIHKPDYLSAEFDLAYVNFNSKRLSKVWIDLIFESLGSNVIALQDLWISRRLRASC